MQTFELSDTVTFLDIGSMSRYIADDNSPQGYTGYEYYQMLSSFHRYLNSRDFPTAVLAFRAGYSDIKSIMTAPPHAL